jgi:hypothetical protein
MARTERRTAVTRDGKTVEIRIKGVPGRYRKTYGSATEAAAAQDAYLDAMENAPLHLAITAVQTGFEKVKER